LAVHDRQRPFLKPARRIKQQTTGVVVPPVSARSHAHSRKPSTCGEVLHGESGLSSDGVAVCVKINKIREG
jgi:hypothetical protein